MIFSQIWERNIFFQILKFIILFLVGIYFLYVVIDFSTHSARLFTYSQLPISKIFIYYLHHFIMRLDLFLPLSLLLAIIKVVGSMNVHRELVALQMGGISPFKLIRPIMILGLFITLFSFINHEFLNPKSLQYIESFKESHLRKNRPNNKGEVNVTLLKNGSKLVYQKYYEKNKEFFDTFWITPKKGIWHIKYLYLNNPQPVGRFVDHLQKNNEGIYEKKTSYDSYIFTDMPIKESFFNNKPQPLEQESISGLIEKIYNKNYTSIKEKAKISSYLNYKIAMPFLPLLIILAIIPFCIKFSRNMQIFIIAACALFGFIGFYTMMDAVLILGENRVFSPVLIIWTPNILGFTFFGWNFYKHR